MPKISRDKIDRARTGHGCHKTIGCKASQRSVFANGRKILRPGDRLLPHKIPKGKPVPKCVNHPAKINRGSRTVFIGGRPVARKGDSADKGKMINGSPNVFAG
tara:strand:+ start:223 stop:531 length:309 start_codon:yes stop_codon:yes gene_type:complete